MMTIETLIARAAALGVAAFLTLTVLAGIDNLATGQHAGATLAAGAAAAHTAAVKAAAPRT
jgi:hypothetical protein